MAVPYDPDFTIAFRTVGREINGDQEHDASASAAIVAVDLLSSARLAAKLDSVYTQYSSQYLLDNARPKKKGGKYPKKKGGKAPKKKRGKVELTVKHCLEFALKEGIPKAEDWPPLGSLSKPLPFYKPALVSMKGELIEAKNMLESDDLLWDQPVGAKLHVFRPQIDLVGEGIYCGGSGEPSSYVGLRDGIIVNVEKIQGKSIATVKLWYKNQFQVVNVAMSRMFARACLNRNDPWTIAPTLLLIDFVVPRLSIN